ncbi:MAG: ferredoxin [Bacilli bacterium]|nr:ferredoxin [Bacilli bacterium]
MKVKVNQDACIGCGACVSIAEGIFEINGDGISQAKVDVVPEDKKEATVEAMESCPTAAIVEVKEEK